MGESGPLAAGGVAESLCHANPGTAPGFTYYYNVDSGESTFEPPKLCESPGQYARTGVAYGHLAGTTACRQSSATAGRPVTHLWTEVFVSEAWRETAARMAAPYHWALWQMKNSDNQPHMMALLYFLLLKNTLY